MKSVIMLTTPTSASGSLLRIATSLNEGRRDVVRYYKQLRLTLPAEDIASAVPPPNDHLLYFNHPPAFNRSLRLSDYQFIANFRDPRDQICNAYAWQFSHPTSESEEQKQQRIINVRNMGIDRWVIAQVNSPNRPDFFGPIFWVLDQLDPKDFAVATYAQLCCDFDAYVNNLARMLGAPTMPETEQALELERPENLTQNDGWIGHRLEGSDILPGRYKRELQPETIAALNERFMAQLRQMARHDPGFADQYLEGL